MHCGEPLIAVDFIINSLSIISYTPRDIEDVDNDQKGDSSKSRQHDPFHLLLDLIVLLSQFLLLLPGEFLAALQLTHFW